jgi:hypothetical protein
VKLASCVLLFIALFRIPELGTQSAPKSERPTESEHLLGPNGMAGWTLNYPNPDRPDERYPRTLILSRHGRIIRRFVGEHYVWKWIFWADGHQVAYKDGPPHFVMRCVLADVATGRRLADVDCFGELPSDAPHWLRKLEDAR